MNDDLEAWIGRPRTWRARLDAELARRYAAAVGAPLDVERVFPPLGHWAYFNETVGPGDLGPDGHPRRGLFMPPVALPRRMFAAADFRFAAPLELGEAAELDVRVVDIRHRTGRIGELMLVDVERRLSQGDTEKLVETQTIVYRAGEATAPVVDRGGASGEIWRPTVVDLFRFSAATFNSHRIHYDQAFVREEEGYPDLVVHGPFTAARLCDLAMRLAGATLKAFAFRALSPLFVGQPVGLRPGDAARSVVAVRCDGQIAMSATFEA
jgi:3-methylfumaryl-CoA hydratase